MHPSNQPLRARCRRTLSRLGLVAATLGLGASGSLAQDVPAEVEDTLATCSACHGADGNSVTAMWPSLAGQHTSYTVRQLEAYRDGRRTNPSMQGPVALLTDSDIETVADYYAAQRMDPKGADPAAVDTGERIYRGGIPERGIAACIACHGPRGLGNPLAGYPRVSHQHADYLAQTLRDYRAGERRSDAELNQMMRNVAEMLLDDEIDALASYMQGLN